jgi:hypothetical protein
LFHWAQHSHRAPETCAGVPESTGSRSVAGARAIAPVEGGFIMVFWGALWLAGLPAPQVDDLFYAGAPIAFATKGRTDNQVLLSQIPNVGRVACQSI